MCPALLRILSVLKDGPNGLNIDHDAGLQPTLNGAPGQVVGTPPTGRRSTDVPRRESGPQSVAAVGLYSRHHPRLSLTNPFSHPIVCLATRTELSGGTPRPHFLGSARALSSAAARPLT